MPNLPVITSILATPGFSTNAGHFDQSFTRSIETETVLVGVVLDKRRVVWGICAPFSGSTPALHPGPFRAAEAIGTIEKTVAPVLEGRRLTTFSDLSATLETLHEIAQIIIPLLADPYENEAPVFSRRSVIKGQLLPADKTPAPVHQLTVERPIHPAIRYGLSQALLGAVAGAREKTLTEVLCDEYNFPRPVSAVPFQAAISRGQTFHLLPQIASLGYATRGSDAAAELGSNGVKLQRFVRSLRENLADAADDTEKPALHLALNGGLGQIAGEDLGKILGALYGLQQAAAPFAIRIEDPILKTNRHDQAKALNQLKQYLALRHMTLQLAAGAWINEPDDIQAFLQADAPEPAGHMIRLHMARLGTIQQALVAVKACRERGAAVLLEGTPLAIAVPVALAARPDLLAVEAGLDSAAGLNVAYDEMTRILTWQYAGS